MLTKFVLFSLPTFHAFWNESAVRICELRAGAAGAEKLRNKHMGTNKVSTIKALFFFWPNRKPVTQYVKAFDIVESSPKFMDYFPPNPRPPLERIHQAGL